MSGVTNGACNPAIKEKRMKMTGLIKILSVITIWLQSLSMPSMVQSFMSQAPHILVVASGSMAPNINQGDLILVQSRTSYNLGEVVSYYPPSSSTTLVTHRITEVNQKQNQVVFGLKGDSNASRDALEIPQSQILGKVVVRIPKVGFASLWLQTPAGVVTLVVIPLTIFIYEEVLELWRSVARLSK